MKNSYSKISLIAVVFLLAPQIAFATWWNPVSWFSIESQTVEQRQSQRPTSSSTPLEVPTTNIKTSDTKTIEGLREEIAFLKVRLAHLEERFGTLQTSTVVQPALTGVDVSQRVVALESKVDALSIPIINNDTSWIARLDKLEKTTKDICSWILGSSASSDCPLLGPTPRNGPALSVTERLQRLEDAHWGSKDY